MTQVENSNITGMYFNSALFGSFTLYKAGIILFPACLTTICSRQASIFAGGLGLSDYFIYRVIKMH